MTDQTPDGTDRAERAFRAALSRAADGYDPAPLPRAASRRRSWWQPALAAAAVLLVGGSLAAVTLSDHDGDGTGVGPGAGPSAPLPAGWHYEARGDVVLTVPDSWQYFWGPDSSWCVSPEKASPPGPYVDVALPVYAVAAIGCPEEPAANFTRLPERYLTTHLFFPTAAYAATGTKSWNGWTQITSEVGDTYVAVLADESHIAEAREVLASAQIVDRDQFGCPATSPVEEGHFVRPAASFDIASIETVDTVSVCQYYLADPDRPGLIASRQIAGADADALLRAIQAAPLGSGPNIPQGCIADMYDYAITVRLVGAETHELYVYYNSCDGNGFDDGTHVRSLTADSCRPLFADRIQFGDGNGRAYEVCKP